MQLCRHAVPAAPAAQRLGPAAQHRPRPLSGRLPGMSFWFVGSDCGCICLGPPACLHCGVKMPHSAICSRCRRRAGHLAAAACSGASWGRSSSRGPPGEQCLHLLLPLHCNSLLVGQTWMHAAGGEFVCCVPGWAARRRCCAQQAGELLANRRAPQPLCCRRLACHALLNSPAYCLAKLHDAPLLPKPRWGQPQPPGWLLPLQVEGWLPCQPAAAGAAHAPAAERRQQRCGCRERPQFRGRRPPARGLVGP